jgi:DinB superfamily
VDGEVVIHHLPDSESNSYLRVRKLLAEDDPMIQGYDQERFAQRLQYERPAENSLAVFRAVRASTAELLDRLGDEDWSRAGTHSESGAYSMEDWLETYAAHAFDHADQIRRAAARPRTHRARGPTPGAAGDAARSARDRPC